MALQSMTAFARVQEAAADVAWCWEIRTVNHRYVDVICRLPESWRFLEPAIRQLVNKYVVRGKVEITGYPLTGLTQRTALSLDEGLINSLLATADMLSTTRPLQNDLTVSMLLNWPGVVVNSTLIDETRKTAILTHFEACLDSLVNVRIAEGAAIYAVLYDKLSALTAKIQMAKEYIPEAIDTMTERLQTKLAALNLSEEGRIHQEIALLLTKMDVSEELDRLTMHSVEMQRLLNAEDSSGRRLDMLAQELQREANTLGAKSTAMPMVRGAMEMKVLIEEMREQIQNVA